MKILLRFGSDEIEIGHLTIRGLLESSHGFSNSKFIQSMANHPSAAIRAASLFDGKSLTNKELVKLVLDPEPLVLSTLICSEKFQEFATTEHIITICKRSSELCLSVIERVEYYLKLDLYLFFNWASKHADPSVRYAASNSDLLPPEIASEMILDADVDVRLAAIKAVSKIDLNDAQPRIKQ
jgi:hypothetical protein